MNTLVLVRHAEARKNLRDEHGGSGSELSARGHQQNQQLVRRLRKEIGSTPIVVAHAVPQVVETATHVASAFGVDVSIDDRLRGIDLGVLAGLSREEARARFPDVADRLEQWRCGCRRIDALDIPGAECVDDFRRRVERGVMGLVETSRHHPIIAVLTRSTLIMVVNLVRMADAFDYAHYRPYTFAAAGVTILDTATGSPKLLLQDDVSHLANDHT